MTNDYDKLWRELLELINQIENVSIRNFTKGMVYSVSDVWRKPASQSHHLLDEREPYGNLLHSVRVASLSRLISSTARVNLGPGDLAAIVGGYSDDVFLSAAILHDMRRYGLFDLAESSEEDHPKLVRQFAMFHHLTCEHFNEIMSVIETHMGRWSKPPITLTIDAHTALHLADAIVARWAEVMPTGSKESTND